MTIRVLLFASLAERVGAGETTIDLPVESRVADAMDLLGERYPDVAELRDKTATAVNMSYVTSDHVLEDGDELALIPPVSGGRSD